MGAAGKEGLRVVVVDEAPGDAMESLRRRVADLDGLDLVAALNQLPPEERRALSEAVAQHQVALAESWAPQPRGVIEVKARSSFRQAEEMEKHFGPAVKVGLVPIDGPRPESDGPTIKLSYDSALALQKAAERRRARAERRPKHAKP